MPEVDNRSCHRLLAIVRTAGPGNLTTGELLALADWLAQPPSDVGAYQWAEEIALPVIQELGRRLSRQLDSQRINVPSLLGIVHEMRNAQRIFAKARNKPRAEKDSLYHDVLIREQRVDAIIDEHYRPSLFGETL